MIREPLEVHRLSGLHPHENLCVPKIFRQNGFWSKKSGPSGFSAGKISGFSIFKPEKIRPKKFRGKKIRPYRISGRKFLGGQNFEPCHRKAIGGNFSGDMLPIRRETRGYEGFSQLSLAIFWEFLRSCERSRPKISGMKSSSTRSWYWGNLGMGAWEFR